jgi:MFS family permease
MAQVSEAVRLCRKKLIPVLLAMYVFAFLDRANIGFAKQAFQASTGTSEGTYAFGAGLFFLTYALFELPSSLIMYRLGARLWLSRIMVTWGLASAAMMFAHGPASFYGLRALLGAAEAGFFPSVILYLTYWFPASHIGHSLGLFYFGAPLAFIAGGPLSGLLLEMHEVGGLQGWQWMFLIEGLLASAVGLWAYFYLDDAPQRAAWLPADEKLALLSALSREREHKISDRISHAIVDVPMLHFMAIYFLIQMTVYGIVFYLPSMIGTLLHSRVGLKVGIVAALPWICALAATYVLPRVADRMGKQRAFAVGAMIVSAVGIAASTTQSIPLAILMLCLTAAAFIAVQPIFWTFPAAHYAGAPAAAGIALINSVGTLGGFVAPNCKHWAEVHFGSETAGQYTLACAALTAAVLLLGLKQPDSAPRRTLEVPKTGG